MKRTYHHLHWTEDEHRANCFEGQYMDSRTAAPATPGHDLQADIPMSGAAPSPSPSSREQPAGLLWSATWPADPSSQSVSVPDAVPFTQLLPATNADEILLTSLFPAPSVSDSSSYYGLYQAESSMIANPTTMQLEQPSPLVCTGLCSSVVHPPATTEDILETYAPSVPFPVALRCPPNANISSSLAVPPGHPQHNPAPYDAYLPKDSTPCPHDPDDDGTNLSSGQDLPYSQLLYRALHSAPGNRLTLQEIYQWFLDNTDKVKDPNNPAWRNSIRHNLSMNAVCGPTSIPLSFRFFHPFPSQIRALVLE